MGSFSDAAIASNRRRFPPPYQPMTNSHDVEQNAVHQQWRVDRDVVNSFRRASSTSTSTGTISSPPTCCRLRTRPDTQAEALGALVERDPTTCPLHGGRMTTRRAGRDHCGRKPGIHSLRSSSGWGMGSTAASSSADGAH